MPPPSVDVLVLHRRALAAIDALLVGIDAQDLERPTPCGQWDLRALLEHIVGQNHGLTVAVGGEGRAEEEWEPRPLGDNPGDTVVHSSEELTRAFVEDGTLARSVWMPEIRPDEPLPAESAVRIHLLDTVVHAWDVGQSVGRTVTFDDAVLEVAAAVASQVPDDESRETGQAAFAAAVAAPDDSGELARLVAWLGRSPLAPTSSTP